MLDRYETSIDWIGIVARDDDRPLWHFELNELLHSEVVELPLGDHAKGSAARLATLKTEDAEQKREQEND